MLNFKSGYEKESKKLLKKFNKCKLIGKHEVYERFMSNIKYNYKDNFRDLESIRKEKNRIKLEIKCAENPAMNYVMAIFTVILGFLLKTVYDVFDDYLSNPLKAFIISCIYATFVMVAMGSFIIKTDRKLRVYIFSLQALNEIEEEMIKNKKFDLTLKNIEQFISE